MAGPEGLCAVRLPVRKDGFRTNSGHRWQPFFCEASGARKSGGIHLHRVGAEPVTTAAPKPQSGTTN